MISKIVTGKYDAQVFVTHDHRLVQLKPEIEIVFLDNLTPSR
jgi:hypothetical protein